MALLLLLMGRTISLMKPFDLPKLQGREMVEEEEEEEEERGGKEEEG